MNPPPGSRMVDPSSCVAERRLKDSTVTTAPGAATMITMAACGLGSDRSVAGGLRKGGSAAAKWLGNGGSTLACSRDKGSAVAVASWRPS